VPATRHRYCFQIQVANPRERRAPSVGQRGATVSDDGGPTPATDYGRARSSKRCGLPPDSQALLLIPTCGRRDAIQSAEEHTFMAGLTTESVAAKQQTVTRPAVGQVAAFDAKTQPADMAPESRQLYNRNVLDGLGCASVALRGAPIKALQRHYFPRAAPGLSNSFSRFWFIAISSPASFCGRLTSPLTKHGRQCPAPSQIQCLEHFSGICCMCSARGQYLLMLRIRRPPGTNPGRRGHDCNLATQVIPACMHRCADPVERR